MRDTSHAGLSPATIEAAAGLSAGVVSTLAVHPLDIVKTRMQINSTSRLTTSGLLRSLAGGPHPLASLYRGLTPNLVGNATSACVFFLSKSWLERRAARLAGRLYPSAADYLVASGLAGAGTLALTNPIWVLKTRMLSSDRAAAGAYPSMLAGARAMLATEGWRAFYRGLAVSMLGVSHGAVQFAVYEPAKRAVLARSASQESGRRLSSQEPGRLSNQATLLLSSFAKLVAGAVTYPYQVVRTRLQDYHADERYGRGVRAVVAKMWTQEGVLGFYRGLVPGLIRVMPATWVTFLVYENAKYYLPQWYAWLEELP